MTAEMINIIDEYTPDTPAEELQQKVDRFCTGIEDLLSEWNLLSIMMDESKSELVRYLTADHVSARIVEIQECRTRMLTV